LDLIVDASISDIHSDLTAFLSLLQPARGPRVDNGIPASLVLGLDQVTGRYLASDTPLQSHDR